MKKIDKLNLIDLYWIAGFFEGEGTFCRNGGTITVAVSQVNKEPIDKLYKLLGGRVNLIDRSKHTINSPKWSNYYRWTVYGEAAELVMKRVYPIMSKKIQNKITNLLSWYSSRPNRRFYISGRKFCQSGLHQWNDENTFVNYKGQRTCRLCNDLAQKRYRFKKRVNLN